MSKEQAAAKAYIKSQVYLIEKPYTDLSVRADLCDCQVNAFLAGVSWERFRMAGERVKAMDDERAKSLYGEGLSFPFTTMLSDGTKIVHEDEK